MILRPLQQPLEKFVGGLGIIFGYEKCHGCLLDPAKKIQLLAYINSKDHGHPKP